MTKGSILNTNSIRITLLMRRICKSLITTNAAEFSLVKPDTEDLWFEGKIVVKNGMLEYERLVSNCDEQIPQGMLVDLNDWYQDIGKKGVA